MTALTALSVGGKTTRGNPVSPRRACVPWPGGATALGPALGLHASPEPVLLRALAPVGLKCTFRHRKSLLLIESTLVRQTVSINDGEHVRQTDTAGAICRVAILLEHEDDGFVFATTDWTHVTPSEHAGETGMAFWRTQNFGEIRVRMVEYSPGYKADHWCTKGHVILCLEGELETDTRRWETGSP